MYLVMMSSRGALVNMFYTENYRSSGGLVSVRDQGGWGVGLDGGGVRREISDSIFLSGSR